MKQISSYFPASYRDASRGASRGGGMDCTELPHHWKGADISSPPPESILRILELSNNGHLPRDVEACNSQLVEVDARR